VGVYRFSYSFYLLSLYSIMVDICIVYFKVRYSYLRLDMHISKKFYSLTILSITLTGGWGFHLASTRQGKSLGLINADTQ
jgi:hypothetical protein